jgi:hypothetical protein
MVVVCHNPILEDAYERRIAASKPKMVALIAAAHHPRRGHEGPETVANRSTSETVAPHDLDEVGRAFT